ncbi:MAG: nucleotidyltransferase family protein [Nitrososphaeria archaeon]
MKAYLLAGGLGTRLYPLSLVLPKPLLTLGNRTVIEHILEWLSGYEFESYVVVTSGREWAFRTVLGDSYRGRKVIIVSSDRPLGTAGQLRWAAGSERETFFVTYTDSIIRADISSAVAEHRRRGNIATIMVAEVSSRLKYGIIEEEDGAVKRWIEKPEIKHRVAAGAFIFEPEFLRYIREEKYGMNWAIQNAISAGERVGTYPVESFIDVGNMESFRDAAERFAGEFGEIL